MVTRVPKKDNAIVLRFGYGLNTRASEDELDPRECADGQNFLLDLENKEFRNRPPFDLAGTAPNTGSIDGFAQLVKADGTFSTLVQAGTNVYKWTGGNNFTMVGTVAPGTKMRGPHSANWTLADKVIITDIALVNPVQEWDGTTFKAVAHNLGSSFLAKYCYVQDERAIYGNVISNGTATPHLFAGSKVDDYTTISVSNKPSSALGAGDPFFLLTPDLKPLNAIVSAFGETIFSSEKGRLYILTGSSAQDYAVTEFYADSGASGAEATVFIGNDVAYGRQGRIESVIATANFGDVENDDISRMIADQLGSFTNWTAVFNKRVQRGYFFPSGQQECWVLYKPLRDQEVRFQSARALQGQAPKSFWSKYTTTHPFAFTPTAVMSMYDPIDGLEYAFMGDSSGNIYRMEGSGSGDGGTAAVDVTRTSPMFTVPLDAEAFNFEGWIKYRRNEAFTATITLLWSGNQVWNESVTIDAPNISGRPVYNGGFYYSGTNSFYSAPFSGRFTREPFGISGKANEFQIKVEVSSSVDFRIAEVGVRFEAAS